MILPSILTPIFLSLKFVSNFLNKCRFVTQKTILDFLSSVTAKILCKLEVDISLIIIAHPVIYSTFLVYSDINL